MANKPDDVNERKIKNRVANCVEYPFLTREEFIRHGAKFIFAVDEAGLAPMYSFIHRTLSEDILLDKPPVIS
jgi:hypothetical protein